MRSGCIEKPVANISVSTMSRAPSAAAFAIIGRTCSRVEAASSQTMSCWTSATFMRARPSLGDRSVGHAHESAERSLRSSFVGCPSSELLESRQRLVQHLGPLAEGEADQVVTGRRIVEDAARDRYDADPGGQLAAEADGVAADVHRGEVRGLRTYDVEAELFEPVAEQVALQFELRGDALRD